MTKFYMPDEEIRRDYTRAKDKGKQIEILADMNLVSKHVMREKLIEMGLLERNAETKSGAKKEVKGKPTEKRAPLDEIRAMELWNEGCDDVAMADSLGVPISRVKARLGGNIRMEPRAASPTCCQPGRSVEVWAGR